MAKKNKDGLEVGSYVDYATVLRINNQKAKQARLDAEKAKAEAAKED